MYQSSRRSRTATAASVFCLVFFLTSTAFGQSADRSADVYGGFAYQHGDETGGLKGAQLSASFPVFDRLSIEGILVGTFGSRSEDGLVSSRDLPDVDAFPVNITSFRANIDQYVVAGGPKYTVGGDRVSAFAHGLVGVAHRRVAADFTYLFDGTDFGLPNALLPFQSEGSDTAFAWIAGGGVDVKLSDRVSVRVVEADYLGTRLGRGGSSISGGTQSNVQVSSGIVFRF